LEDNIAIDLEGRKFEDVECAVLQY